VHHGHHDYNLDHTIQDSKNQLDRDIPKHQYLSSSRCIYASHLLFAIDFSDNTGRREAARQRKALSCAPRILASTFLYHNHIITIFPGYIATPMSP
jgi:hypothetical protein